MTVYVLDTNVWSDVARGIGKAGRKLSTIPMPRVLVAAPALYELRRVPPTAAAWKALNRLVTHITSFYEVTPFDVVAANHAADLANTLRAKGRTLHHIDMMVAGIAIARGATLVTRDKDFAKAPGLKIESWT
ncbi:MAG: hypothetical protein A4S17_12220 [Proteobacteria bacterium HN_bin10]|nr:MAG: hypothetical protein A4S17_12220 [Proteobacteria bacterium HN_bin10]